MKADAVVHPDRHLLRRDGEGLSPRSVQGQSDAVESNKCPARHSYTGYCPRQVDLNHLQNTRIIACLSMVLTILQNSFYRTFQDKMNRFP